MLIMLKAVSVCCMLYNADSSMQLLPKSHKYF